MMELLTLYRGKDKAIVERGSPADKNMRLIGFVEKQKPKTKQAGLSNVKHR